MKTALKQAIEKIKDYPFLHTEDSIVSILTELLEAEKGQIMEAFAAGYEVGYDDGKYDSQTDTDYYAKTFK